MEDYSIQHKKAWEFDAYDFWVRTAGSPQERAAKDKENPVKMLKQYANYFDSLLWTMELRSFMGKRTVLRTESRSKSARTINGYSYKQFC